MTDVRQSALQARKRNQFDMGPAILSPLLRQLPEIEFGAF